MELLTLRRFFCGSVYFQISNSLERNNDCLAKARQLSILPTFFDISAICTYSPELIQVFTSIFKDKTDFSLIHKFVKYLQKVSVQVTLADLSGNVLPVVNFLLSSS